MEEEDTPKRGFYAIDENLENDTGKLASNLRKQSWCITGVAPYTQVAHT